jgi:peptidoglycan/xylan/chitin deacetylase (PgdA/CDA1 family)
LCWLKENDINVVSLDEGVARLAERSAKKFCVFTFDDGYADNLLNVLPLMERYNAPFTVYVTTGMITGEIDAWWLGLARLVASRDRIELPELGGSFDCLDQAAKKQAFIGISGLAGSNLGALAAIKRAFANHGIDCRALVRSEGLSSEQLQRLAASPLVTIGAHGVRHINLARAATTEVEQEMVESRRVLEELTGRGVFHFSYPFGGCGEREVRMARAVGFNTAVTTQHGTLFAEHLTHSYALPREPIFRADNETSLRLKLNGAYRAWHSGLRDPVARL